ncbi:hypothetical protein HMPREF1316_1127 [Olsenella profusa F0195]|uniref:Uncharacterized protein n=1 Tax=Olsenella profusa F0195 TaxID=1125712 RepID=U2TC50_9ACTN|nr:hypothetical protein HMPREF1316_1127 [Olsenella profusa F0195]
MPGAPVRAWWNRASIPVQTPHQPVALCGLTNDGTGVRTDRGCRDLCHAALGREGYPPHAPRPRAMTMWAGSWRLRRASDSPAASDR